MANDENYGLIEWPDGRRSNPSDIRGGYTGGSFSVKPSEIPALSKSGKAWFTATARKARSGETGQQLADLARALKAAPIEHPTPIPLTETEDWALVCRMAERTEGMAERGAFVGSLTRERYVSKEIEYDRANARRAKSCAWFAFGGDGKVVLSLRTSREAALEIAVAYNKAGGDLVLLAPSRDLASTPTEACVAIP